MLVALVVASGAPWESAALAVLAQDPGIVVLKRCVDVDDLLACATAGQAQVAVLGLDSPDLDANAVEHLRSHGVRPVAVLDAAQQETGRMRCSRIGISAVLTDDALDHLPVVLSIAEQESPVPAPGMAEIVPTEAVGRVVVVWGAAGAPGRSTIAAGIAAELARRRARTILVDADPYGGSLAQQLGVLDETSGLLAAARRSGAGTLREDLAKVQRGLGEHLSLVSGLPRPDRWVELRPGAVTDLLQVACEHAHVVVDTGFGLEVDTAADFGGRPSRNQATLEALEAADEIVVVAGADPVSLSRVARGLVELGDQALGAPVRVVINRMRASLGWSEKDIAGMVSGLFPLAGLHFLPDDTEAVDRALVIGRSLVESGDSAVVRALAAVVDELGVVRGDTPSRRAAPPLAGLRRRRAGRDRPR